MEFCWDLVHDPIELVQEVEFTPRDIVHEDLVEIYKHGGKTTIRYGEAYFFSHTKAIHICFLNGKKYLTVFDRVFVTKYTFPNGKMQKEKAKIRSIPDNIDSLLDLERLMFGCASSASQFIPIRKDYHPHRINSAPL